jgi:hypothetical protein
VEKDRKLCVCLSVGSYNNGWHGGDCIKYTWPCCCNLSDNQRLCNFGVPWMSFITTYIRTHTQPTFTLTIHVSHPVRAHVVMCSPLIPAHGSPAAKPTYIKAPTQRQRASGKRPTHPSSMLAIRKPARRHPTYFSAVPAPVLHASVPCVPAPIPGVLHASFPFVPCLRAPSLNSTI